jgi:hypothetical protein
MTMTVARLPARRSRNCPSTVAATIAACLTLAIAPLSARAQSLASADFGTYSDGALVGQNGWQQWRTETTSPLTVSAGRVAWPGGATTNNQDAFLPFPSDVVQPASGTTVLNFDMTLSVDAPSASNPSYFAALNTNNTSSTSGNFQNARIVAQTQGTGYVFGTRVNGQSGYPWSFGTQELTIGQDYALRAEINMVAGNANDFINLYVGPDFDNLSLYTTAGYGSGSVNDPSFGSIVLSQFGTASVIEAGVSVGSISVTQVVPEPSTIAMAGVGLAAAAAGLRRRMRQG